MPPMDDQLRYDVMVENALRRVVADTLKVVAERGLPGSHHFYISFLTGFPGVQIPSYLHEQYPKEMTIVLQYQYYGLVVNETNFSATLSFNNVKERLVIPLAAITTFADPSVDFALQFQSISDDEDEDGEDSVAPASAATAKPEAEEGEKGVVVSLEQFRKKSPAKDDGNG